MYDKYIRFDKTWHQRDINVFFLLSILQSQEQILMIYHLYKNGLLASII